MIIYCPQPPNRYTENLPTKKYVGRRRDDASGTEGCDGWRSVPTEVHVKLPRAMERRHAASVSAAACTGSDPPAGVQRVFLEIVYNSLECPHNASLHCTD